MSYGAVVGVAVCDVVLVGHVVVSLAAFFVTAFTLDLSITIFCFLRGILNCWDKFGAEY